jgi:hypothetical protein
VGGLEKSLIFVQVGLEPQNDSIQKTENKKRVGGVAQVVEHLLSKCEALGSFSSMRERERGGERERERRRERREGGSEESDAICHSTLIKDTMVKVAWY